MEEVKKFLKGFGGHAGIPWRISEVVLMEDGFEFEVIDEFIYMYDFDEIFYMVTIDGVSEMMNEEDIKKMITVI